MHIYTHTHIHIYTYTHIHMKVFCRAFADRFPDGLTIHVHLSASTTYLQGLLPGLCGLLPRSIALRAARHLQPGIHTYKHALYTHIRQTRALISTHTYKVPGRVDLSPPGLGLFVDLIRPQAIDGFLTPDFQAFELNGVCLSVDTCII